jgi:hypothetical protein
MLQAAFNLANEIPGVKVQATNIHQGGQLVAAVILTGCVLDDVGNLVLATSQSVGNVGKEAA